MHENGIKWVCELAKRREYNRSTEKWISGLGREYQGVKKEI